jgi:hypothetical protein
MTEEDDVRATIRGSTSGSWLRGRRALLLLGFVLAGVAAFFFHRARRQAEDHDARVALQLRLQTEELAIRRRACRLPEGATLHEAVSVQGACQAAIVTGWRSPGSVVFPGMFDEDGALESLDGCVTTYRSWAIGPGPDGSNVRQPYVCTFDPRTGTASIDLLER